MEQDGMYRWSCERNQTRQSGHSAPYLTDAGKLQTIKSAPLDLHLLSFSVVTSTPVQQHNLG